MKGTKSCGWGRRGRMMVRGRKKGRREEINKKGRKKRKYRRCRGNKKSWRMKEEKS